MILGLERIPSPEGKWLETRDRTLRRSTRAGHRTVSYRSGETTCRTSLKSGSGDTAALQKRPLSEPLVLDTAHDGFTGVAPPEPAKQMNARGNSERPPVGYVHCASRNLYGLLPLLSAELVPAGEARPVPVAGDQRPPICPDQSEVYTNRDVGRDLLLVADSECQHFGELGDGFPDCNVGPRSYARSPEVVWGVRGEAVPGKNCPLSNAAHVSTWMTSLLSATQFSPFRGLDTNG